MWHDGRLSDSQTFVAQMFSVPHALLYPYAAPSRWRKRNVTVGALLADALPIAPAVDLFGRRRRCASGVFAGDIARGPAELQGVAAGGAADVQEITHHI